jgi:hypothetical protein
MHARGLRPRGVRDARISHSPVLPSAHWNSVGTLISDHFRLPLDPVISFSRAVGTSATAIASWTAPPWMVFLTATSDYRQSASALSTNQHSRKRIFRRSAAREQPDPAITRVVFPKPSQSILDPLPEFVRDEAEPGGRVCPPFALGPRPRNPPIGPRNFHKPGAIPHNAAKASFVRASLEYLSDATQPPRVRRVLAAKEFPLR